MMFKRSTRAAARGKWRGILLTLGLPETALSGKHVPCPMCGGKDRFRWDNKEGNGTYICSACGAGDGMKLAIEFTGNDFREVAKLIDDLVDNITPCAPQPVIADTERLNILRMTIEKSTRLAPGDLGDRYLSSRELDELIYPKALRYAEQLYDGEGIYRPCMIAIVADRYGKMASLHRTFLAPDGSGKADMSAPRKLMPGSLTDGACVRLGEYVSGGPLGIAEGIETALSASAIYDMPVWAALNASMLKKWIPPEGCEEVAIFGDNDASFAGHEAAYGLAKRLRSRSMEVTVKFPLTVGDDYNDVHIRNMRARRT